MGQHWDQLPRPLTATWVTRPHRSEGRWATGLDTWEPGGLHFPCPGQVCGRLLSSPRCASGEAAARSGEGVTLRGERSQAISRPLTTAPSLPRGLAAEGRDLGRLPTLLQGGHEEGPGPPGFTPPATASSTPARIP